MRRTVRAAAMAVLALSSRAGAQPAPGVPGPADDPVLAALVAEALANNPDLRAAAAIARAARERPAQAAARPDPMLALTYTNEGWTPSLGQMEDSALGVMVSQDLTYPGKRRLRGEIAAREADEVDQQVARARLSIAASVRRSYAGLLQARALLELIHEQEEIWRQIEGVVRARYAVGQGNQQDVLRTQVEQTRSGQLLAEQEAEAAVGLAELNRLTGRPAEERLPTSATLVPTTAPGPLDSETERLRPTSPELAAAAIAQERARLALALARKEYKPDFAVLGGYMNRGHLDPMWQAGLSVTLPMNRRRRASGVAEAEALAQAAEALARAVFLQFRFRTQERLAQLAAARETTTIYQEGIVPQDRMSVEAAIASYQAGRVPFIAVLEALTTLYGDRATLVRLLAGQARLRASLEEASLEATSEPSMSPARITAAPGAGSLTTGGAGSMGSMGNR